MGIMMNQEFVERGIYPADIDDGCDYRDKVGFRGTVGGRAMAHNDELRRAEADTNTQNIDETNQKLLEDLKVRDEPNMSTYPAKVINLGDMPSTIMKEMDEALLKPIIIGIKAFMDLEEEQAEDLVEVPEVPVCFGNCADNNCVTCKDKPECDTHECGTSEADLCEFAVECQEEFTATHEDSASLEDIAQEETNEETLVHGRKHCFNCNFSTVEGEEFPCRTCSRNMCTVAVYPRDMWVEA
jgi:hypothetical protein